MLGIADKINKICSAFYFAYDNHEDDPADMGMNGRIKIEEHIFKRRWVSTNHTVRIKI